MYNKKNEAMTRHLFFTYFIVTDVDLIWHLINEFIIGLKVIMCTCLL